MASIRDFKGGDMDFNLHWYPKFYVCVFLGLYIDHSLIIYFINLLFNISGDVR